MTDMSTSTTQDVTCDCGATGHRDIPAGKYAGWLRGLKWMCDDCDRKAQELRAAEEAEERRVEAIERRDRRARHLPAALRGIELAGLERTAINAAAIDAAAQWATGELAGLVLTGPVGTGKTTIAAAAAWGRMQQANVAWTSVPVLLANALAAFDSDERRDAVRVLTGTGALVLDDLDKSKASDWAAAQLFAAIDQRYSAGAPLLVTMNLTPGGLGDRLGGEFGDAIASRLTGYCRVVRVDGGDRRLKGAA